MDTIGVLGSRGTHHKISVSIGDRFFSCYEKRSKLVPVNTMHTNHIGISEVQWYLCEVQGYHQTPRSLDLIWTLKGL